MKDVILIPKELVCGENRLSEESLCVYAAIRYITCGKTECYISNGYIEHILFDTPVGRSEKEMVSKGLNSLLSFGYIKILKQYRSTEFFCDVSYISMYSKSEFYIELTLDELRKIMNINEKCKYKLLKYFLALISTFDSSGKMLQAFRHKVGKMPQSYLANIMNVTESTIINYNKHLTKHKLMFIAQDCYLKYYDQSAKCRASKITNIYGKYSNKDIVKAYINAYCVKKNHTMVGRSTMDESRKYVQMYNAMLKGKEYDNDVVLEIYEAIKLWNEDKKIKYEDQITAGHHLLEPKYKDLSIFNKYGLND